MNHRRTVTLSLAMFGMASSAHAQFGNLLGGIRGGGGGDVSGLVDKFNAESALISGAVGFSLLQIQAALGSKQDAAKAKESAEQIAKTTDPKERGALLGTVIKDQAAKGLEILQASDAISRMEKLSEDMQKRVAQAILGVAVSALKIPGLLDTGKQVISGAGANPAMLPKVASVKDGISMLADSAPKLQPIVTTGFELLRKVKIDPGNPTKDSPLEKSSETIVMPDE